MHFNQEDYPKALKWFLLELSILEKAYGKKHIETAECYDWIADTYKMMKDYIRAIEYYQITLDILEKCEFEGEHEEFSDIYDSMAHSYLCLDDYANAFEWYKKALDIYLKTVGEDHRKTARVYSFMGHIHCIQGDNDIAEKLFQKVINILERIPEKSKTNLHTLPLAYSYGGMANVYFNKADYPTALVWYKKTLETLENTCVSCDDEIARVYYSIAKTYSELGDLHNALQWFQKAYIVYEDVCGKEHPELIVIYDSIETVKEQIDKNDNC
jgi:tetratricopeptide (TPR) repeat protein